MRDPGAAMLLVARALLVVLLLSAVEWCPVTTVEVGYRLARLEATDDGAWIVNLNTEFP